MPARSRPPAGPCAGRSRLLAVVCTIAVALTLLAGAAAAQESEETDVTPARVAGLERFETAARIADLTFDTARDAILVTGLDYPDALAGSFAAGRLKAPILLVEPDGVPQSTRNTLDELGVERVVLLGGTSAIGEGVEATLEEDGYAIERIAGETRYETAAEIALRYGEDTGNRLDGDRPVFLASGEDFPDALSAGPLATRGQIPLLLTPRDQTVPVVDETLAELGIERILVVGGTAAVSEAVVNAYADQGYTVERWSGPTRDATATVVAHNALTRLNGFSDALVLLARGDDFPDALAASVHGAALGAPILLTASPEVLGGATDVWLARRCPDVDVIRALGGTAAVSDAALHGAVDAATRCDRPGHEVTAFATPLTPNADRTHNIHLAADYIRGDVIAAGASYSLNEGIGPRTRERGFREVKNGCIGAGGKPVDCVGGGVSQMGTTFLNVAWFSGIEILHFRPHSLYFDRYPVCREATLGTGALDVRVHNDSPYDIVIDTFYDNAIIGVRFLSHDWARVDSWSQPERPPSSGGFSSSCGRTITYPDGTTSTDSYSWTYRDTGF